MNKRKLFITIVLLLAVVTLIFLYKLLYIEGNIGREIEEVYVQGVWLLDDFSKFTPQIEEKAVTKEGAILTLSNALQLLDNTTFDASKHEEELNSITEPTNFIIKEDKKYELSMDLVTGEIISYSNSSNKRYKTTKKTKEQVIQIADEIISKFELPTTYECTYAYPFDEEIWSLTYQAKYGELYSPQQLIKFSISPEEKTVMSLRSHGNTKTMLTNTEYKISMEDAKAKAQMLAEKRSLNICRETSGIVEANYFWTNQERQDKTYIYRLAYIFTCNDEKFTQIYVDAETGDLIGGSVTDAGLTDTDFISGWMIPEPDKIVYYNIGNKEKVSIMKDADNYREIFNLVVNNVPERELNGRIFMLLWADKEFDKFKSQHDYIMFEYNSNVEINKNTTFEQIMFPILKGEDSESMITLKGGNPINTYGDTKLPQELIDKLNNL